MRKIITIIAALAALVGLTACAGGTVTATNHPIHGVTGTATSPVTSTSTSTTPTYPNTFINPPPAALHRAAVRDWITNNIPMLTKTGKDMGDFARAAGNADRVGMVIACGHYREHMQDFVAKLPSGDARLDLLVRNMSNDTGIMVNTCIRGGDATAQISVITSDIKALTKYTGKLLGR
jgi:hypothetical protein